jgi:hypothetical protein
LNKKYLEEQKQKQVTSGGTTPPLKAPYSNFLGHLEYDQVEHGFEEDMERCHESTNDQTKLGLATKQMERHKWVLLKEQLVYSSCD